MGGKGEGQEVVTLLADLSSLLQGLFFYQVFSLMILVLPHQTVFLPESPTALSLVTHIWKASSRESSANQHRLT